MTLTVIILLVCLILALVAGVVETCIASWMIRRYTKKARELKSSVSSLKWKEEELSEANLKLNDSKIWQTNLCEYTISSLLFPVRAQLIKACKASAATETKEKGTNIMSTLVMIKDNTESDDLKKWITDLIYEVNSIMNPHLEEKEL